VEQFQIQLQVSGAWPVTVLLWMVQKSCTTCINLANNGINYLSTGAGRISEPSTVSSFKEV